jgi:hypothetical protein
MPPAQLESRRDVGSQLANDALARPQILSKDRHIVRKSVEHSLSFYAYKYSLLWNLLEKEGAVYKASLYLAR